MLELAHPKYLWFLLILIPYILWYFWRRNKNYASLRVSSLSPYRSVRVPLRAILLHGVFFLRVATLAVFIIILARPQTHDNWSNSRTEGTDIVLALDISTSMLARDFEPDRFEAAKNVAAKFINGRENDNIGLVIFAGESYTAVPMTTDRSLLINYIKDIRMGMIEDGTAIGDGLATAINRIKDSKAKSKSIILLTDGSNNTGNVAPQTAAEIAKELGIKVYTIGIGKNGNALFPQDNGFGMIDYVSIPVVIDENTLMNIASMTKGKYFRATDNDVLSQIFEEIDSLEKSEIDVRNYHQTEDDYIMWAWIALILILSEVLLRNTILRNTP